jgi:hypothetical protein
MNILSKEAVNHLLDTYATKGGGAARALAPKYGIKPIYVKKLACKHGVKAPARKPRKRKLRGAKDPRWQWAVERGGVVA